jgi:L-amino acid N-acyltransferase YncA
MRAEPLPDTSRTNEVRVTSDKMSPSSIPAVESFMTYTVDALDVEDWDAVQRIYQQGLDTGNASFETTAPAWEAWNAKHHPHSRFVAREDGRVVAWAALAPVSPRACYAGVAEVSVYVADDCRGRGVGNKLLTALIESSEANGIWTLYGATFPENVASLRLQAACGFRLIGRRERIGKLNGIWRDTVMTERRSRIVGAD